MTQAKDALPVGSARIRLAGRFVGQSMDCYMEQSVTKLEHFTNVNVEFRRDFVLPIQTAYDVGFTFGEIVPWNVNAMLGMPGFRAVPIDRKLSNAPFNPGELGTYSLQFTEMATLGASTENQPTWSPLMYPIAAQDSGAPAAPRAVFAKNISTPGPVLGYVGIFATQVRGSVEGPPSTVSITPFYNSAGSGDNLSVKVVFDTSRGNPNLIRLYRYVYTYNATYQMYIGTYSANGLVDLDTGTVGIQGDYTVLVGDLTAGYATILGGTTHAANGAGTPPISIVVKSPDGVTTYQWLTDFEVSFQMLDGAGLRRVPTGTIPLYGTVNATYWYDATSVYEAPLGYAQSGKELVVPVTLEHPFPDNRSKFIWHFWRGQVRGNFRYATNERDWMGIPFTIQTLDASDVYPDYPFGYVQVVGPLARRIVAQGNVPFSGTNAAYPLGDRQTTYA